MQRLKVFVSDGRVAGLSAPPSPHSLTHRADLLLRALLADLAAVPEVEALTMASADAAPDPRRSDPGLATCIEAADAVWPLALESDGMLERLSRDVLRSRRVLLGCPPGAVRTASSKLGLARALADGGVAVVATYSPHAVLPQLGGPWVVKPDDGAGCLHTRLFSDRAGALAWIRARPADDYVLQPFVALIQAACR